MKKLHGLRIAIVGSLIAAAFGLTARVAPAGAVANTDVKAEWVRNQCTGPLVDPWNDYIAAQVNHSGRFNIGAFQPAPWDLLYAWPSVPASSFTTIRVDGIDSTYGDLDHLDTAFVQPPYDQDSLTNVSMWQTGDIVVTQTLQITTGTTTGNPDTIRIQYDVQNGGAVPHEVGVRAMMDIDINYNDGAPFRIPGFVDPITTETELFPPEIPQYYQSFFDLSDLQHVAQGTLGGADATLPDRFVMVSWPDIVNTSWEYEVTAGKPFGTESYPDNAVALYWNPVLLAAGESRRYVTYYGIGGITGTADLSISGPAQLDVVEIQWAPNPFTVVAYLKNNTLWTITGNSLTLDLSGAAGLVFAPGEEATRALPDIRPGDTVQASWSVIATAAGTWTYSVSDASALAVTAERSIVVPEITTECTPRAVEACQTDLLGVCAQGTRTCTTDGSWDDCVMAHPPAAEVCGDAIDNDCDGLTDGADPACASDALDCREAVPSLAVIWPPDKSMTPVSIGGMTGSGGAAANVTVDAITQDEPVSDNKSPDASGVGTLTARIRADRLGNGNGGRVYVIRFTAQEAGGGACQGSVSVCVPHDENQTACVDDGQIYDSTVIPTRWDATR